MSLPASCEETASSETDNFKATSSEKANPGRVSALSAGQVARRAILSAGALLLLVFSANGAEGKRASWQQPAPHLQAAQEASPTAGEEPLPQRTDGSVSDGFVSDYRRAERLLSWNLDEKVHRMSVDPHWIGDNAFWYRLDVEKGHRFLLVEPSKQARRPAFDHERLAGALEGAVEAESTSTGAPIEAYDLPFETFQHRDGRSSISFTYQEARWRCSLVDYVCRQAREIPEEVRPAVLSPDGSMAAYRKGPNLWVRDLDTGEDLQLTTDGEEGYAYAIDSQGWRRSETPVLRWSPGSRRVATFQQDERNTPRMYRLETNVGRPVPHSRPYAVPGDEPGEFPMLERVVIDVESQSATRLDMAPDHLRASSCCGLLRDGRLVDTRWNEEGDTLAVLSTSRDYNTVTLRLADARSGTTSVVYQETDKPFFESALSFFGRPNWRVFHDSGEFLWFTRKSGWGHLYLHDLATGAEKRQITSGNWNVLEVLHADEEARTIWFSAVGREPDANPYHPLLYRVNFDGTGLRRLTPENAAHSLEASPSGKYIVDTHSTFSDPPETVVRGQDGTVVMPLETARTDSLSETPWSTPERFTVKARDGETTLHGLMHKPSDFDPSRKYPIISAVYPGPQTGSIGSREFSVEFRGQAQALAELGFIVVQIDALGTPLRSKAFHTAWHGDMSDNGIPDQKAGIEQLAKRHDWIDADRVGIYGHSGGGYATTSALFQYPDFFDVGVASAGNHDNRGYTDYWGEKYQGLQSGSATEDSTGEDSTREDYVGEGSTREDSTEEEGYAGQANQLQAENLEGELLLAYGTMDDNVSPNMTLLVISQLIEHNKDFDLVVMPNRDHGFSSEPYFIRRTWDYFVRHLLEKTPPEEYEITR
ncbi:S9 family peptidase [Salinibacter altiplanensis]|uniref:S9 family peptidase n=1 Tax=Salinibacter altiplanensis TaxID=1803181 RepID=UPI000C9ED198|nr:DPP IV N-terminal domain-containing protein [Salinibacter altiplanensis]